MQGQQNEFMNALNTLSQQLAGQQASAGTLTQQGNIYSNIGAQQGNAIASLYGQQGAIAGPAYQGATQSNQYDTLMQAVNNIASIIQNPNSGLGGTTSSIGTGNNPSQAYY